MTPGGTVVCGMVSGQGFGRLNGPRWYSGVWNGQWAVIWKVKWPEVVQWYVEWSVGRDLEGDSNSTFKHAAHSIFYKNQ